MTGEKIKIFVINRNKEGKLISYPAFKYDLNNLVDLSNSSFLEKIEKNGTIDFIDKIKDRMKK